MRMHPPICLSLVAIVLSPVVANYSLADLSDDHFEKQIRPLLMNKCVECHSGRTPDGNLDLSSKDGFEKGGMGGALVDGMNLERSSLYARVLSADPDLQMPPKERLSQSEIESVKSWIEMGPTWPSTSNPSLATTDATDATTSHWAFSSIVRPAIPQPQDRQWCKTDIDRFILSKLESANLKPVGDAVPSAWLRRASLDSTGLPPTMEELHRFLEETSPEAKQQEVDRMIGSRAFAERQARHWLDLARYADTSGDGTDTPIPEARYYRDWVIDAIDRDMPYDQFITEQIAGDILAARNPDAPDAYQKIIATGYIAESRRFANSKFAEMHQIIDDSIDTIGRSMLGLSLGCARCHHHKFDPITTEDYYGIYGYFASTQYPHAGTEHQKDRSDFPEIKVPAELESVMESKVAWAVHDKPEVGNAKIHIAGDPHKKGTEVPRGYLAFLSTQHPEIAKGESGRLQFANWIASKDNPLTARVMANRIWQSHFGRGLVPTTSNFGLQAPEPRHLDLLNYLAAELIEHGWSMKHLHRVIMSSHVYELASAEESEQLQRDEANELYWHFPRQRMDAETFRDSILAVSGRLKIGTNGRHPFKPTEKLQYNQGNPFAEVFDHEHRSVYLMTPRLSRHPMMSLFDGADANVSTPQRGESTVPLQSLFLLNGSFINEQSAAFVQRLCSSTSDLEQRIANAWQLSFSRMVTPEENAAVRDYLERYSASRKKLGIEADQADREAWTSVARSLFASNEFMYFD